jgi:hypothetical protein
MAPGTADGVRPILRGVDQPLRHDDVCVDGPEGNRHLRRQLFAPALWFPHRVLIPDQERCIDIVQQMLVRRVWCATHDKVNVALRQILLDVR